MAQPYPPGCPRTVEVKPAQWTYLQRRFAPGPDDLRIVALVNSGCGSDCEGMTAMLASLPETLVAGTNTYGVMQNIQPGYSVLPHTGLRYRIALGRSDYFGDGRSVDGYGLDVDVVLPEVDSLKPMQLRELAEQVAGLRN
jgi:C-terminal processing protease CtpA/Prc